MNVGSTIASGFQIAAAAGLIVGLVGAAPSPAIAGQSGQVDAGWLADWIPGKMVPSSEFRVVSF